MKETVWKQYGMVDYDELALVYTVRFEDHQTDKKCAVLLAVAWTTDGKKCVNGTTQTCGMDVLFTPFCYYLSSLKTHFKSNPVRRHSSMVLSKTNKKIMRKLNNYFSPLPTHYEYRLPCTGLNIHIFFTPMYLFLGGLLIYTNFSPIIFKGWFVPFKAY